MARQHARAVNSLGERARVAAVVDPVAAARAELLAVCPGADEFEALDQALRGGNIDVVHVCTPPDTHESLASEALEAGCHIYVEKPFSTSRETAERLMRLADSRGLGVCAGHQLLFESPAVKVREATPSLGRIVHIESYFSFRPVRRGRDGGAAMRADAQLLDILPHPVYLLLASLRQASPEGQTVLRLVEVGRGGTVHAIIGRGDLNATLIVTLAGRPVESHLRLVGENGQVHADFVRGTAQRLIGPGSSGIDKLLNPFRVARQLTTQTFVSIGGRISKRRRSYPGLAELFGAFYASVVGEGEPPMDGEEIVETVSLCEQVAAALPAPASGPAETAGLDDRRLVVVTGGTGFLGRAVTQRLIEDGFAVRVLARRVPTEWERIPGVEYAVADLGAGLHAEALDGAWTVIHCAAETSGGWDEHQRNSLDATENVLRAAAAAGVEQVVHVSSLAVIAGSRGDGLSEQTPLVADARSRGPYVWGKAESEALAGRLADELGLELRIVRPGALVDYERFDPPGRLGRRIGNIFVAVGGPREPLGVTSIQFGADALAWTCSEFDQAPEVVNLLEPELPTRRALLDRLKERNPDLRVVWLPRFALHPLSWFALGLQKVMRPGKPAISVAKVFAREKYDTTMSASIRARMLEPRDAIQSAEREPEPAAPESGAPEPEGSLDAQPDASPVEVPER